MSQFSERIGSNSESRAGGKMLPTSITRGRETNPKRESHSMQQMSLSLS